MAQFTKKELDTLRNYSVIKSNDMVLKGRFDLSVQEQRIILYLVSKIKQSDTEFTKYPFSIQEFGEICGIDISGGKEYKLLKDMVKKLADKSFWVISDDEGSETLLRWLDVVTIKPKYGVLYISLHSQMMPYLLELKSQYLDYKLYNVLAMKSQYGIRFYELIKTEYNKKNKNSEKRLEQAIIEFDIEYLKKITVTENYTQWNDFKRRVLENAKKDINTYSDLVIEYEPIKTHRTFTSIHFFVRYKTVVTEGLEQFQNIEKELNSRRKGTMGVNI